MFLLGLRRNLTALALCKSIESTIQWFQMHHGITFATIHNPAVYLSGARVRIFSTLVPRLNVNFRILKNQYLTEVFLNFEEALKFQALFLSIKRRVHEILVLIASASSEGPD